MKSSGLLLYIFLSYHALAFRYSLTNTKFTTRYNTNVHTINANEVPISETIFPPNARQPFGRVHSSSYFEEDINFCLRECDTALSAVSRSKILNELTNNVMKALIIGYEPIVTELSSQFENYRELVDKAQCVYDDNEILQEVCGTLSDEACDIKLQDHGSIDFCTRDLLVSRIYIDRLEKLLLTGSTQDSVLGGIYDRGYKRLLTILKDTGCQFRSITSSDGSMTTTCRPKPIDQDICLSMLDKTKLSSDIVVETDKVSKTMILNTISNVVYRTVLYGRKFEKNIVIRDIEKMIPTYAAKYTNNNMYSQEVLFLKILLVLLKDGLVAAENVVMNKNSNYDGSMNYISLNSGLKNGYLQNITTIDTLMSERLYDTYQNAFHRIVECCFTEIGRRSGAIPENNEILVNIVNWEKNLRLDMTEGLWKRNPSELAGIWTLADVAGEGSLTTITLETAANGNGKNTMTGLIVNPRFSDKKNKEVSVELRRDGKVIVQSEDFKGDRWTFTPGPAHLDTCEFILSSQSDSNVILKYVGFIDRGQRIESRFSKMPVRMTGRVITIEKGVIRGSNRFIMLLPRTSNNRE